MTVPVTGAATREEKIRITLGALNHLMTYEAPGHSKGVWVSGVGWVCGCGLAIRYDPERGRYEPK